MHADDAAPWPIFSGNTTQVVVSFEVRHALSVVAVVAALINVLRNQWLQYLLNEWQ